MSKLKFITSAVALSVAVLFMSSPASALVIWSDDFNRGGLISSCCGGIYGQDTVGNGWTEVQDSSSDVAIRGTVSDQSGNYVRLRDNISSGPPDAGVAQLAGISTAGFNNIMLSYDLAPRSVENPDSIFIEWKLTTDMSWNLIQSITAASNSSTFTNHAFALGVGAANITNLQFRFYTDVSRSSDEWRLDNVVLSGDAIPTPEPGTLGLLGFGLTGIGALYRRRKANKAS